MIKKIAEESNSWCFYRSSYLSWPWYSGRSPLASGGFVSDSVAVDAKRILLRYGAPINLLDEVSDEDRIALAREIAKTDLPKREKLLRQLLAEGGYGTPEGL